MIVLSFSLPKTATTLLQDLAKHLNAINSKISSSKLKEPSFFIDFPSPKLNSYILDRILVRGNYFRGKNWYLRQFTARSFYKFDFSTQYWLHKDTALNLVAQCFDLNEVSIFWIKRQPTHQILSYIDHLRRGYVDMGSLKHAYHGDTEFANYLDRMNEWYYFDKQTYFANLGVKNIFEFEFDDLVADPFRHLQLICENFVDSAEFDYHPEKHNQSASPRIALLNRLLFSRRITDDLKNITPSNLYPYAINLRKNLVKLNLTSSKASKFHFEDKEFIESLY